jgi:(2Fe-2S) ferredoxin
MWTVKEEILFVQNLGMISNKMSEDAVKEIVLSHFTERTISDYIFYGVSSIPTSIKLKFNDDE